MYCRVELKSLILLLLTSLPLIDIARAAKLPLRHFTTQEGLAGSFVHTIVRDSKGLLWFCTNDGLSRFDGQRFVNFGSEQGLGDQEVTHLLETSAGVYWVGTARGVSRMSTRSPTGELFFANFLPDKDRRSQWTHKVLEDDLGRVWIATNGGLYRMSRHETQTPVFEHIALPAPRELQATPRVLAVLKDESGQIWVGADSGLYRITTKANIERYSIDDGLPGNLVLNLTFDHGGALWVAVDGGLCRVRTQKTGRALVDQVYTRANGLPDAYVASLHARDEELLVGTFNGLVSVPLTATGRVKVFGVENGLRHPSIESFCEDQQGNIWIGSMGGGASRLAAAGFTTYNSSDGLASVEIAGIVETSSGELHAVTKRAGDFVLNRFDGDRFIANRPRLPPSVTEFGWGWAQIASQDKWGEWWIATSQGVVRYPRVSAAQLATAEPRIFLESLREVPRGTIFRVFSDSRGDLWISTSGYRAHGLARWDRLSGSVQRFGEEHGLPGPAADHRRLASAFAEDASGTLWIGFHRGGLVRFQGGRLNEVRTLDNPAIEGVRWIHRDRRGRLWIAGRKGLHRIDDPGAQQPVFRHYGMRQGLASSMVLSITEDNDGRIYVGSGRGVDRLDVDTGNVRHYSSSDGLVGGDIRIAHRDKHGYLWFGSTEGLSRYDPRQERPLAAPNILISDVRVGSHAVPVAHTGEVEVSVPPVGWRNNAFYVEFLGVGEALRYQYQLEGVDAGWSEARDSRSAHYPALAAGSHRFLVRAVNPDGNWSPQPATVRFRIESPVWARWWFRTLVGAVMVAIVVLFHRMRVDKAVALERVRNRLAANLHDDVGASLSHAALLSELIQRDEAVESAQAQERLGRIGEICREALDSIREIVWATDPKKDRVGDLTQRMHGFAEEMLEAKNIELLWSCHYSSEVPLAPEVRHEIFLVFKEAIHNVVRHSGATRVSVEIATDTQLLTLKIVDNGVGLPACAHENGQGLGSMRARVASLGGTMWESSIQEGGARLEFGIPLRRRERRFSFTERPHGWL